MSCLPAKRMRRSKNGLCYRSGDRQNDRLNDEDDTFDEGDFCSIRSGEGLTKSHK